jgi:RNA polymerase sigma factor (sigma-70 family)
VTTFEAELLTLLPKLRRFARALTRDPADADDVCQTAIERALNARASWQDGTRLDAWMYRIVRNCWIDETRSRGRAAARFAPEHAGLDVPGDGPMQVESAVTGRDIDRATAVEGLAYRDAAEILEVPMGTLTSRLGRGRQALMAMLEPGQ